MAGASLTISRAAISPPGPWRAASARAAAGNGHAFGGGLFLQGNESITLAPASGTIETIRGVIADQTGSGGTGANAGAGASSSTARARSTSTAANTYTGGTTIDQGVLELGNSSADGSGEITFASTSGEIEYAAGANLADTISSFGPLFGSSRVRTQSTSRLSPLRPATMRSTQTGTSRSKRQRARRSPRSK